MYPDPVRNPQHEETRRTSSTTREEIQREEELTGCTRACPDLDDKDDKNYPAR